MNNTKSKCYLDSNFFVYYKDQNSTFHLQTVRIIKKLIPTNSQLYISSLVIDEFLHSLKRALIVDKTSTREVNKQLEEALQSILDLPHLEIINPPTDKIKNKAVLTLMKQFNLKPRDAYHLLIMKENGIEEFATFDNDFKKVFEKKILKLRK